MQSEPSQDPIGNDMFVVKWNNAAVGATNKAAIAICNIRDKPSEAKENCPTAGIQYRFIRSDVKNHVVPIVHESRQTGNG